MRQVIMEAESLQGYLTAKDTAYLQKLDGLYNEAMRQFVRLDAAGSTAEKEQRLRSLPPMILWVSCCKKYAKKFLN